ncbi:MAG: glycosyltransferase family 2 protein [Chitinophagaceae bacterium]|nr:glycosyltransferase family 2 protein [Chitinophagaceae bacterium]
MVLLNIFTDIWNAFAYGIFFYSLGLMLVYIAIAIASYFETQTYLQRNKFTDYSLLASSEYIPTVSILAPAYNEGKTIIDNIQSLLSVYYSKIELIVINDGSTDDGLQKMIKAFNLEKVDFYINYVIPTKKILGVYKSTNPAYSRLIVVDKENGGKGDALNAGINIATNHYFISIDVDCVLEHDAILKMVKPFLEQTDKRVIASGGVLRIANSCHIEKGRLLKVRMPREYLPRVQSLEYIRSFILGRMAWSRLNGLMLISGAFGMFDREIVIEAGGYNTNTVGEDMELVIRMRRYMEEQDRKYKVIYIPDPLCWTEAPNSLKVLGTQRNRWTRGLFQAMVLHKRMLFNPRYGLLGMLSYPYWFFFELLAPIVQFIGFVFFFIMALMGLIEWGFFFGFLLFIICFGYTYSVFAIYMEVSTYNQYRRRTDVFGLILTSLTEPFFFQPYIMLCGMRGYIDLLFMKDRHWGEMPRLGFNPARDDTTPVYSELVPGGAVHSPRKRTASARKESRVYTVFKTSSNFVIAAFKNYLRYALVFLLLLFAVRIFEIVYNIFLHGIPKPFDEIILISFIKDAAFFLEIALPGFFLYLLFYLVNRKLARIVFILIVSSIILFQVCLCQYFLVTTVPMGNELWSYPSLDFLAIITSEGWIRIILILLLFIAIIAILYHFVPYRIVIKTSMAQLILLLFTVSLIIHVADIADNWTTDLESTNNLSLNKSWFLYNETLEHYTQGKLEETIYSPSYTGYFTNDNNQAKPLRPANNTAQGTSNKNNKR